MIVIFGYAKDAKPVAKTISIYCYRCQCETQRLLRRETEWVTFFLVKTIPFFSRHYIVCERCGEAHMLDRAALRKLKSPSTQPQFRQQLEDVQLAGKSEIQRNFLQTQRARMVRND